MSTTKERNSLRFTNNCAPGPPSSLYCSVDSLYLKTRDNVASVSHVKTRAAHFH